MSKQQVRPDSRLKNIAKSEDASTPKESEKLVEVRKTDTSQDDANEFVVHEKPFDEQMHESFDDLRKDHMDEEAD